MTEWRKLILDTHGALANADNLARIVQDNIAAEMIFPTSQTTASALKGKEDLLSQEILKLLGEKNPAEITMAACPFARYSR